ncbi:tyrosine-protein phosphatase [Nocardioides sp. W3-2-3]|nr:tyrosine-protein phosphatase [Nocardioides convexus]
MSENEEYLRLASADNFRDVAGPGYATTDGGRVRTGVFYRSNDLRLTEADHGLLERIGLRAVIDLRSPAEIALHPDPDVPGAEPLHFDAIGIPMERIAGLTSRAEAVAIMEEVYRAFVTHPKSLAAFGAVLRQARHRRAAGSSTAPPARTAPAGSPHCSCTSRVSTTPRSRPTTCSPTPAPPPPAPGPRRRSPGTSGRTRWRCSSRPWSWT